MADKPQDQVKVFTTPSCPYCNVVKAYLYSLKVDFKEIDLSQDRAAGQWLSERLGNFGIPVTFFGDEIFVLGWQRAEIDDHLRRLKLI